MIKFFFTAAECNHFLITNVLKKNPKIYNQKVTTFCSEKSSLFLLSPAIIFFEGSRSRSRSDSATARWGRVPYIHIFDFLGSKCCHIYTFFTQPAVDEKNLGFLGEEGVKMVPYIHIFYSPPQAKKFGFLGYQNGAIYTHL